MQDIDGIPTGQMVIRLPKNEDRARDMIRYLQNKKIKIEEVRE